MAGCPACISLLGALVSRCRTQRAGQPRGGRAKPAWASQAKDSSRWPRSRAEPGRQVLTATHPARAAGRLGGAGESRLMTLGQVARQAARAARRPKEQRPSRSMHPTQLLTGTGAPPRAVGRAHEEGRARQALAGLTVRARAAGARAVGERGVDVAIYPADGRCRRAVWGRGRHWQGRGGGGGQRARQDDGTANGERNTAPRPWPCPRLCLLFWPLGLLLLASGQPTPRPRGPSWAVLACGFPALT